jgi:hypothetical protein
MGCAQQQDKSDPRDIHGINPAFTPYVQKFEAILGRSIGDIPIQFAPQGGNTIGVCEVWNSQYREIKIDPDYWNASPSYGGPVDDDEKLSLIFHELGHCVLNRGHLDTSFVDSNNYQVMNSWMNWYVFFNDSYPESKSYYLNELFNPAPGSPGLNQSVGGPEVDEEDFVHKHTK